MRKRFYEYGMKLRGFSPGCQPKDGLIYASPDQSGKYHDLLTYDRILSADELRDYELEFVRTRV